MAVARPTAPLLFAAAARAPAAAKRAPAAAAAAAAAAAPSARHSQSRPHPGTRLRRLIPPETAPYYKATGHLHTTEENYHFLLDNHISHDNGLLQEVPYTRYLPHQHRQLFARLSLTVNFSCYHIIHPYHLKFLDPRGFAKAAHERERYAAKARDEPLWLITTAVGGSASIVRHTIQNRLRAALYLALPKRGYDRFGRGIPGRVPGGAGVKKDLVGTLWITVNDPVKAVSLPLDKLEFGNAIIDMLEEAGRIADKKPPRDCGTRGGRSESDPKRKGPGPKSKDSGSKGTDRHEDLGW